MGASIFRYGKLIGHCSQSICSCCENQFVDEAKRALDGSEYAIPHQPEGCLNFTPLPQKDDPNMSEQTMSNHARAVKIVKDWRERWGGIPHDTYAEGSLGDLIDRVTEALSPPVPSSPPKVDRYCVIGVEAYQREWFLTLDEAVDHAAKLYEKDSKTKKLLVVHVDKVVESTKPVPPPVEARDPVEVDFIKSRRWNC